MPTVLLFSRQPLGKRPLHEWLGEAAASVVLVTPAEAVAGWEEVLDERFLGHRLVDDYGSWATERVAEEAARTYGVDLIASTSEDDVVRAARLRDRLGLTGQDGSSALAYRDKVVMKQLARAAGLAVPAFAAVDDPLDLLDFIDAQGYPVVVKPRAAAGAQGFAKLDGEADLMDFLHAGGGEVAPQLPGQWMAEGFVAGDFFHVDGVMRGGEIVHCWPSQYSGSLAEYARDESVLSSLLLEPGDERTAVLRQFTAEVIAALPAGAQPCSFHLEAWLGPDGRPVLCEIASRAGGGPIAEAYQRAFGVQLAKEGLRGQCGVPLSLTEQAAAPAPAVGWSLFPPGHGRFVPPAGPCPVPGIDLTLHLEPGTECTGLHNTGEAAASVVAAGESAAQVRERLTEAGAWWFANTRWQ
ncbi:acetyl-CoA carboxylase biotin carboxylase subunit family protein [Kitasatospora sp. NPDC008050]|uniref:ATP-grasp domain-containing protein n=1 Tax=Kitasatospora sp. NPDC008050 TaxID=3364021 RepID=UPI0036EFE715